MSIHQVIGSGDRLGNGSSAMYRRDMIGDRNFRTMMGGVIENLRTRNVISGADLESKIKILVQATTVGNIAHDIRDTPMGLCLEQTMIKEPGTAVKSLEYYYEIDKTPAATQRSINNIPRRVLVDVLHKTVHVCDPLEIANAIERKTYDEFRDILTLDDGLWRSMFGADTPGEKLAAKTIEDKMHSFRATRDGVYKSMTGSMVRGLMCGVLMYVSRMSPDVATLLLYDTKYPISTQLEALQFYMKKTNLLTFGVKKRNMREVMSHFKMTFDTNCDTLARPDMLPEIEYAGMKTKPDAILIITRNTYTYLNSIGCIHQLDTTFTQKMNEFTITRMDLAPTHHMVSDQNIKMSNGTGSFEKTNDGDIMHEHTVDTAEQRRSIMSEMVVMIPGLVTVLAADSVVLDRIIQALTNLESLGSVFSRI